MNATPAQAEQLAIQAIDQYLVNCGTPGREAVGNYLMKLVSVAGVLMANAEGSAATHDRLQGTANFILKSMPAQPGQLYRN